VQDAQLKTIDGSELTLKSLVGEKGLVIALTNTSCPICKKYGPTLSKLEQSLASKGIKLLLVNPSSNEKAEDAQAFIKQHNLKSSYVLDPKGTFANQLNAKTTTEVFLLDSRLTLAYRGAIDDQYGLGYTLEAPKLNYLQSAVVAMLSSRKADPAATTAPGCELDLKDAKAPAATAITYHNRISRIVQTHCIECHRTGGVAPFKLETAEEVIAHAGMIRKVVDKGTMPPWFATPGQAGKPSHWANDRSVPKVDKEDLLTWLKSERTLGNPSEAPIARSFEGGWLIGKPDSVYEFSKPVQVQANGFMRYQNVLVETNLTEDKWVKAVEIRPSAPAVVHHVLVFAIPPGDRADREDEREGFFAAYVPGQSTFSYPEGFAKKLPKGTRLRFQMHYTPNGTATQDSTRIGIIFAPEQPKYEIHVVGIANPNILIKAGEAFHPETASIKVPFNATLLAFMPHMHLRGTAFRYELVEGKKEKRTLIDIPHYDFNWQLYYRLAEPLQLTPGMELIATGWFNNSSSNPANPDPKRDVRWGPQTYDEMMLGYIEYYVPFGTTGAMVTPRSFNAEAIIKRIDTNNDGKLSFKEFETLAKLSARFPTGAADSKKIFDTLDTDKDGFLNVEEFG